MFAVKQYPNWYRAWNFMSQTDIDECKDGSHLCEGSAKCVNNEGSFECTCSKGFEKYLELSGTISCIGKNWITCDGYYWLQKCSSFSVIFFLVLNVSCFHHTHSLHTTGVLTHRNLPVCISTFCFIPINLSEWVQICFMLIDRSYIFHVNTEFVDKKKSMYFASIVVYV